MPLKFQTGKTLGQNILLVWEKFKVFNKFNIVTITSVFNF